MLVQQSGLSRLFSKAHDLTCSGKLSRFSVLAWQDTYKGAVGEIHLSVATNNGVMGHNIHSIGGNSYPFWNPNQLSRFSEVMGLRKESVQYPNCLSLYLAVSLVSMTLIKLCSLLLVSAFSSHNWNSWLRQLWGFSLSEKDLIFQETADSSVSVCTIMWGTDTWPLFSFFSGSVARASFSSLATEHYFFPKCASRALSQSWQLYNNMHITSMQ